MIECRRTDAGFSLMEVNLAILILAIGLMALFSLFPAGLKESELGIADTQEAMFADNVLSMMEGNALSITNWNTWRDVALFRTEIKKNIPFNITVQPEGVVTDPPITYPSGGDNVISYKIMVAGDPDDKTRKVTLWVKHGRYGDFNKARVYASEFVYLGM